MLHHHWTAAGNGGCYCVGMLNYESFFAVMDRSEPFPRPGGFQVLMGVWLLYWLVGQFSPRREAIAAAMKRHMELQEALQFGPHEFAPVRVSDLPWLDE